MKKVLLASFALLLSFTSVSWATTYQVDKAHSSVSFKIRHFAANLQGTFGEFEGALDYTPGNVADWGGNGTIQVKSINTNNDKRDKHLLGPDFFDAEKFPTIEFKATKAFDVTAETAKIEGTFKMHGIEKPIILDVQILGIVKDEKGQSHLGFTATTQIDRKDFGIVYNKALDQGKFVLGDTVTVTLEIEAIGKE